MQEGGVPASPAYRIDGQIAGAAAFYAAACDPRRSVVVEACAGAGKTWMLVSRILRALLDGAEPPSVLAITFTRKAAGEMRERLHEWLHTFASPGCSAQRRIAELRARGLSEADAARLEAPLAGLHARLLEGGRPVEIRTFHGWFSQLLRTAPLELLGELGLGAEMELVEDWADHRPEVYRRFHSALLRDAALRADFDAQVQRRGRHVLRQWLDMVWNKRVEIERADAAGTLEDGVAAPAALWPAFSGLGHPAERLHAPAVRQCLDALAAALERQAGAIPRKQGRLLAEALAAADAAQAFEGVRAALFTTTGTVRKQLDAPGLETAVAHVQDIATACDQQQAHDEHRRMVRLARCLLAVQAEYKRRHRLADMSDLEDCAVHVLGDATLAGWMQERLDARIRHLLIDEFQDTSPLQWHALHAWLSSYAGAGGGASGQRPPSVFIVGDPKQSIYRFRRAEPRVFEAARRFVQQALDGQVLECDHTRRNAPGVLEAVNAVFGAAQREGQFEGFRAHTTDCPQPADGLPGVGAAGLLALPRVERTPAASAAASPRTQAGGSTAAEGAWRDTLSTPRLLPEEALRRQEARRVAQAIVQCVQAGTPPADIMVLSRKRAPLQQLSAELQALHVPHAAADGRMLAEAIEVRDLLAVLDVLSSTRHRLSLAHALRSPVFGASDADLVALAEEARPDGDWWAALHRLPAPSPALLRARTLLAGWRTVADRLPPHDLLDRIVHQGEVRERVAAVVPREQRRAALDAVDALLEQALTLDGARYATPYGFVRALRRRTVQVAAPVQPGAVRLLTVHGAKGLEAPVVFVMDSDPEPQNAETATVLVDWPVEARSPAVCAFVHSEARCPPSLQPLLDREVAARRREELNSLYVAMTRARRQLVFSATEPFRAAPHPSWWQRVQPDAAPWQPPDPEVADAPPETVALAVLPGWTGAPPEALRPAPALEQAARLGEALHRVLEWATRPHADPAAARPELATLAQAAAHEFTVDAGEVQALAGRILHSPACRPFFDHHSLRWAGNEVPVSVDGQPQRIDRLVAIEDGGGRLTWWVLDYKLHPAPHTVAAYRRQLLDYRRAVARAQPGEAVRAAFVTGAGAVVECDASGPDS